MIIASRTQIHKFNQEKAQLGTDGALYSISSSHHTKMRRSEGQAVSRYRGGASYGPWPERKRGEVQFMHFAAQLSEADI